MAWRDWKKVPRTADNQAYAPCACTHACLTGNRKPFSLKFERMIAKKMGKGSLLLIKIPVFCNKKATKMSIRLFASCVCDVYVSLFYANLDREY